MTHNQIHAPLHLHLRHLHICSICSSDLNALLSNAYPQILEDLSADLRLSVQRMAASRRKSSVLRRLGLAMRSLAD